MRRCGFVTLGIFVLTGVIRADWVVLKDGRELRGVDLRKWGSGLLFTLEDGKTISIPASQFESRRKSPRGERVAFRGRQVTLREKIRTLRQEYLARQRALVRIVERWARGGAGAAAARAEFTAQPADERECALGRTLDRSSYRAARELAAEQLMLLGTRRAVRSLAVAAITDRDGGVRETSRTCLAAVKDPAAGVHFVRFLRHGERKFRVRASKALRDFPVDHAVPALIVCITKIWTDGGRAYFYQGTRRAYISDYEVVSGGTGFTLAEVAVPVVKYVDTGVVLDVTIAKAEQRVHFTTLRTITRKDFGSDVREWAAWWNAQPR